MALCIKFTFFVLSWLLEHICIHCNFKLLTQNTLKIFYSEYRGEFLAQNMLVAPKFLHGKIHLGKISLSQISKIQIFGSQICYVTKYPKDKFTGVDFLVEELSTICTI